MGDDGDGQLRKTARGNINGHGQPSLFGPDPAQDPSSATANDTINSEAEVFGLAREVLGTPAPRRRGQETQEVPDFIARKRKARAAKAATLGLVARWGDYKKAKGHVSIHDPATGEWHDLPWKDAPSWAKWEAGKHSEIYRATGDSGVFDLTASQMREIWEEDHPPEEGIVEEHALPDD